MSVEISATSYRLCWLFLFSIQQVAHSYQKYHLSVLFIKQHRHLGSAQWEECCITKVIIFPKQKKKKLLRWWNFGWPNDFVGIKILFLSVIKSWETYSSQTLSHYPWLHCYCCWSLGILIPKGNVIRIQTISLYLPYLGLEEKKKKKKRTFFFYFVWLGCLKMALVLGRARKNDSMKTGEKSTCGWTEHKQTWQFSAIPWLTMLKDRCLNLADQNEGNWHKDQDV